MIAISTKIPQTKQIPDKQDGVQDNIQDDVRDDIQDGVRDDIQDKNNSAGCDQYCVIHVTHNYDK